jgi:hypothetical protein
MIGKFGGVVKEVFESVAIREPGEFFTKQMFAPFAKCPASG